LDNRQDGMSQQGLNGGNYPPLSTIGNGKKKSKSV
jgi:hypothetical protein